MYKLPLYTFSSTFKAQQDIMKSDSDASNTYLQEKHAK